MGRKILEQDTRRRIYELIQAHPGLHMREISRLCELHTSLVEYHLRHLERSELIHSLKEGGYKRFYQSKKGGSGKDPNIINGGQKKLLHLLRQRVPLTIVLIVLERKVVKHKEFLNNIDVSGSTLSYYLNKLVQAEILTHISAGKEKGYQLKNRDELLRILILGQIKPPTLVDGFISTWDDFF